MPAPKNTVRQRYSIQEDKPSNWFDDFYSDGNIKGEGISWANMATHPSFARWLTANPLDGAGKNALVVGCGMGDDAIELEQRGFTVTAFDISETAISYCKTRFPQSQVNFLQADLLAGQPQWHQKFDFVLEIFTVQALPPKYEQELIQNISHFVTPGGQLFVVTEVRSGERTFENGPPWVLNQSYFDNFRSCGLTVTENTVEVADIGEDLHATVFSRAII
ncbi:MAG: class I SAM-dependent methyltransferase [Pikeienuella sp.]